MFPMLMLMLMLIVAATRIRPVHFSCSSEASQRKWTLTTALMSNLKCWLANISLHFEFSKTVLMHSER